VSLYDTKTIPVKTLTQDSAFGLQVAAAMSKVGDSLRHMLFREAGKKPPRTDQPRTQPALGKTLRLAKVKLRSVQAFTVVPGRKEIKTLNAQEALDPLTDVDKLMKNGDCSIECYIRSGFTDMPPGVTLRTQKKLGKNDADPLYDADRDVPGPGLGVEADEAEARAAAVEREREQEQEEDQEAEQEAETGAAEGVAHADA
jgi:hypothetical protein